ncbi:MetQ/NlpA family ABC transporter substrate-binding protein [Denitrobacterium detoxificans]|jgi:ABC-type metal ion transport system substrate-binding protein|uniref:MetQ/NlpA family ABC transporter substrate-binding protein n=1 Tax=Denitrobacterium detoxificans TaxID=79604 RepID=UPI0026ECEA68|nr:MetQ/NlpA family ABC transporter substrate-binding protein [Denitrobacterium detoxificans]MBE6465858.1 hypothetical protein [Denitrobacterium detoxificans]
MKKTTLKKLALAAFAAVTVIALAGCGASASSSTVKIGIPDDSTNGGRAIKLLEEAGLIEVDPNAGYTPEVKDITKYLYNVEIVPSAANTLPSTLDDFGAAAVNGTYAIPAGLTPSKDALITESQDSDSGENPYVNVVVARSSEVNNATYKTIVNALQTQTVAKYIVGKYQEAFIPAFDYDASDVADDAFIKEIDSYSSSSDGKTVVKVGVCGSSNDYWKAVQKVLDEQNAGIYIELVTFDAYTLPNEALNSGEIDLNSFQHKAYLANEVSSIGYDITAIGDSIMAPLSLYSHAYDSIDAIKEAAGQAA